MSQVLAFLAAQPILLLFVVVGLGSAVGRVKVRGVGLGAAGVLFLAIALSAWAAHDKIDLQITEALGTLGLTLFTFTVGIVSGATFFASLRRNLGPILDANGWAINGRVKINVPFGTALTDKAEMPKHSTRILGDPYAEKSGGARLWILLLIMLGLAAVAIRLDHNHRGRYFWQPAPVPPAPAAPAAPAATVPAKK